MKIFILFLFLVASVNSFTQETDTAKTKKDPLFEISFGQSLLFIGSSRVYDIRNNVDIVVPTNAILFFSEIRPAKKVSIPLFLNIATETKQFLIDGVLVSEKASPTFGTGITYKPFQFKIAEETKLEFEIGPLASIIFDRKNQIRIAPVIASRFRLVRGKYFVMYLGFSYSVGIDAFGLLYGTGSMF